MSNSLATVVHPSLSRAPMMTKGKITPKIVREFESHCTHYYFINAKDGIPDDKKVMKILGCFEESVIDDWTSTHQA